MRSVVCSVLDSARQPRMASLLCYLFVALVIVTKGPTLMIDDDTYSFGSGEQLSLLQLQELLERYS